MTPRRTRTQPNYSYQLTWSPADKGYICTSTEFPGVSAFGPDQQTALAEMAVALEAVLDTYTAEGPPLPASHEPLAYSGQFRLRIPKSLHAALAKRAETEGMSLNSYAALLLSAATGAGLATDHASEALAPLVERLERTVERSEAAGGAAKRRRSGAA